MKNILPLLLALSLFILSCNGCDDMMPCTSLVGADIPVIENDCSLSELDPNGDGTYEVFKVVEIMPTFPGCEHITDKQERKACSDSLMLAFVEENKVYPPEALTHSAEGVVVVRFLVSTEGCLDFIEVVRDPGCGLGVEAQRIVSEMPAWNPGKQRGNPVVVQFNLPVEFELE